MDIKQIQELIRFVAKSGVNEVSIEQDNFKISIKTNQEPTFVHANVPVMSAAPVYQQAAAAVPVNPINAVTPPESSDISDANLITIKSPMIGTFYRSSSPDKPIFVNVGDEVKTGKIVCIIEAMKLFNEIESEVSGTIVKVLVDNASPVEYDQPLFLVQPN